MNTYIWIEIILVFTLFTPPFPPLFHHPPPLPPLFHHSSFYPSLPPPFDPFHQFWFDFWQFISLSFADSIFWCRISLQQRQVLHSSLYEPLLPSSSSLPSSYVLQADDIQTHKRIHTYAHKASRTRTQTYKEFCKSSKRVTSAPSTSAHKKMRQQKQQ